MLTGSAKGDGKRAVVSCWITPFRGHEKTATALRACGEREA